MLLVTELLGLFRYNFLFTNHPLLSLSLSLAQGLIRHFRPELEARMAEYEKTKAKGAAS